jgi:hypothetical protein
MRTARFTDDEILQACREIAGKGVDPTYKSLRAAGFPVCGSRLLQIRDAAVAEGRLTLPRNSRVRAHVAQSILSQRCPCERSSEIAMPTTLEEFLKVERRLFSKWRCKKKIKVGPLIQWSFFFSERRVARWKHTVRGGIRWIRPTKASLPSGQQVAWFETATG